MTQFRSEPLGPEVGAALMRQTDADYFRDILLGMVETAADLNNLIRHRVRQETAELAPLRDEPVDHSLAYERIVRTARRTVLLIERITDPTAAARVRDRKLLVEEGRKRVAAFERAETIDRPDRPDPEDELDELDDEIPEDGPEDEPDDRPLQQIIDDLWPELIRPELIRPELTKPEPATPPDPPPSVAPEPEEEPYPPAIWEPRTASPSYPVTARSAGPPPT